MAHFYLDENIPVAVASVLHQWGHTSHTARDLHRLRASDDQHLLLAAQQGATFVTRNRSDSVLLHHAWMRWSQAWNVSEPHSGILITPHAWLAEQTAFEFAQFIADRLPLQNQFYEWRQGRWNILLVAF